MFFLWGATVILFSVFFSFVNEVNGYEYITEFNGTGAYAELDKTYVLSGSGDFIEFEAKWNDMSSAYQGTLGLFGIPNNSNETIGFLSDNNFYVRGNSSTWMAFPLTNFDETIFHDYRLTINGTNLELYIDDILQSSTLLVAPISISHIANTYATYFTNASVKNFSINSSADGAIESENIVADLNCINCTTTTIYEAPTITLNGDKYVYISLGSTYTESGALANDPEDGNLTALISGTVDTDITGTTTITYSVTDSFGTTVQEERIVTVVFGTITNEFATRFNGIDSFIDLGQTYIISQNGDFIEFEGKWNDMSTVFQGTLGLFGVSGTSNNTIGYLGSTNLGIRGDSTTWMNFPNLLITPETFNTYRIEVVGSNLELYINGILQGTTAFISPISISHIGNTYINNFTNATLESFNISTMSGSVSSEDIINDFSCNTCSQEPLIDQDFIDDKILVQVETNNVNIYKPQENSYIKYSFRRDVNVVRNTDVWRIGLVTYVDKDFKTLRTLSNLGEWEMAIRITGATDFMGGAAHGDELFTFFESLIDGETLDLSKTGIHFADELKFNADSDLFAPDGLSNSGTKVATSEKEWTFNFNEKNNFKNKVTWITSENLQDTYMFMAPILRDDLIENISSKFKVSPLYDSIDITNDAHANPYYTGDAMGGNVVMTSDYNDFWIDVDVLKGWKPSSEYNTSPSTTYNKMYFDFTGNNYQTTTAEIFDTEVGFDLYFTPDTEKPITTLSGASVIELKLGEIFQDPGASAFDQKDKILPVTISGDMVNTNISGTYILNYVSTDEAGNMSDIITRTILVKRASRGGGGGGGGGGSNVSKDVCPEGDFTRSKYDKDCGKKTDDILSEDELNDNLPESSKNFKETELKEIEKDIDSTEKKDERGRKNKGLYSLLEESCMMREKILSDIYNANYITNFQDIATSEYQEDILRLEKVGIIKGREEGIFDVSGKITRAEFLAIVLLSHCLDISNESSELPFQDVDVSSWQGKVISAGLKEGIISGDIDKDGKSIFRPNDEITKIEAYAILLNMREIRIENTLASGYSHGYSDIEEAWQHQYVHIGENLGLMNPDSDSYLFYPNSKLNRDYFTSLLIKVLKLY